MLYIKCKSKECNAILERRKFEENHYVCPKCNHYDSLTFQQRLDMLMDPGTFQQINEALSFHDPIGFLGYREKYEKARSATGLNEAIVTGMGQINGIDVIIGIMDTRFMMSSMGSVVGEKITQVFERGITEKKPIILFSASGGARMQEGVISLMQMAKTSAAAAEYSDSGGLFISVLTNPTTGGVSASYAFLGDIIIAEPNAMIGFAGRRVIQQTINEELPEGFQTSEYLLEHGFLDAIVERKDMKNILYFFLKYHNYQTIELGMEEGA